jgi:hypothetical protein
MFSPVSMDTAWMMITILARFESGINYTEQKLQGMNYSEIEDHIDYTRYLERKAEVSDSLERQKENYEEYKVMRARAKEAMARVEAGEFSA